MLLTTATQKGFRVCLLLCGFAATSLGAMFSSSSSSSSSIFEAQQPAGHQCNEGCLRNSRRQCLINKTVALQGAFAEKKHQVGLQHLGLAEQVFMELTKCHSQSQEDLNYFFYLGALEYLRSEYGCLGFAQVPKDTFWYYPSDASMNPNFRNQPSYLATEIGYQFSLVMSVCSSDVADVKKTEIIGGGPTSKTTAALLKLKQQDRNLLYNSMKTLLGGVVATWGETLRFDQLSESQRDFLSSKNGVCIRVCEFVKAVLPPQADEAVYKVFDAHKILQDRFGGVHRLGLLPTYSTRFSENVPASSSSSSSSSSSAAPVSVLPVGSPASLVSYHLPSADTLCIPPAKDCVSSGTFCAPAPVVPHSMVPAPAMPLSSSLSSSSLPPYSVSPGAPTTACVFCRKVACVQNFYGDCLAKKLLEFNVVFEAGRDRMPLMYALLTEEIVARLKTLQGKDDKKIDYFFYLGILECLSCAVDWKAKTFLRKSEECSPVLQNVQWANATEIGCQFALVVCALLGIKTNAGQVILSVEQMQSLMALVGSDLAYLFEAMSTLISYMAEKLQESPEHMQRFCAQICQFVQLCVPEDRKQFVGIVFNPEKFLPKVPTSVSVPSTTSPCFVSATSSGCSSSSSSSGAVQPPVFVREIGANKYGENLFEKVDLFVEYPCELGKKKPKALNEDLKKLTLTTIALLRDTKNYDEMYFCLGVLGRLNQRVEKLEDSHFRPQNFLFKGGYRPWELGYYWIASFIDLQDSGKKGDKKKDDKNDDLVSKGKGALLGFCNLEGGTERGLSLYRFIGRLISMLQDKAVNCENLIGASNTFLYDNQKKLKVNPQLAIFINVVAARIAEIKAEGLSG